MSNMTENLMRAQQQYVSRNSPHVPVAVREKVRKAVIAHLEAIEAVAVAEWVGAEHVDEAYTELAAIIRRVRP